MKSLLKPAILAFSGAALFASPAMAAISLGAGDLAVAFYQVNGSGVVQPNTFVFDLGSSSLFRENTLGGSVSVSTVNSGITSSNIGSQLVSAFGANWANDSTVRWMVVGGVGASDALTGGDPARTSYISRGRASLDAYSTGPGTTIPTISSTNRGFLGNSITGFFNGTNSASQTVGANLDGVTIGTSNVNSAEDFVPPATLGLYFGQGIDPTQTFNAGLVGDNNIEGALDIYRFLHSTTGADLTAGQSGGNAATGTGQFIGTLTIDSSGNLAIGAIPEPSTSLLLGVLGTLGLVRRKRVSARL